jgi:homoserine dehydrogenase
MPAPLRIGLAGLGTVGGGVARLLDLHGARLAERCGRPIVLSAVSARDRGKAAGLPLGGAEWHDDCVDLARRPDIDVVVELIGGSDGPARALVQTALSNGKHVVTANKALLAHHGVELARLADEKGVALNFEASVAGGIPIVKALREGLAGNRIGRVYGILNGTSNYILTAMSKSGRAFADVLAEAQALGYAEADPSFDVDGIDAAHKLSLLASLAFGTAVDFASVHVEGIRHVAAADIAYARELGYRIKLLGLARVTPHGVEARVHPCLVPVDAAIAHVDGVYNAVVAEGDFVDQQMFQGRGAGAGPTASAVVADLIDIAHGLRLSPFGVPTAALAQLPASPMARRNGCYYLRLQVVDRPGVIADIAAILRDESVSIESLLQRGRAPGEGVPVAIVTHEAEEAAMSRTLARIVRIDAVLETPVLIRIENFAAT